MNKKTNEHWPSVIIMNGRPYQLKEMNRQGINNPCSLCDLRTLCNNENGQGFLYTLCTSDDRNEAWFFEEDWSIFGWRISDFIDPELADKLLDE